MAAPADPPGGPKGLVVVDKEPAWTSHDVVARCRRLFGQRRVGHAGTLDPDATGVLLVGLGRFTRFLGFLAGLPKAYTAEAVLGTATTTLDASGEVTGTWDMSSVTLADVRAAAGSLTGTLHQVPPMVSAVKVDGQRLYQLARQGIEVERPARQISVERFDVDPIGSVDPVGPVDSVGPEDPRPAPRVFAVSIECSTGTYVRSLVADLGAALGGGAHVRNLRRVRVGSFTVDEAHRLEELAPAHLLSPAQALRDLSHVVVDTEMARIVSHGLALDRVSVGASGTGPWAVLDRRGRLLAVYQSTDTDRLVAARVLESA